jgi:hypothetical protein
MRGGRAEFRQKEEEKKENITATKTQEGKAERTYPFELHSQLERSGNI